MISRSHVVAGARVVRLSTTAFAVSTIVGFIAVSTFSSQYGSRATVVLDATSSDTALAAAVLHQQRSGLHCSEKPTLTDVVLFQRDGAAAVTVLTFDQAIKASSASEGWIRRYCI
ncbi:hypothetical protein C6I20_10360 [Aeromicrobium sp. A1-2]|uniref:hypothetical protein n=1 Tax=Aeromicrobium sp. A1-2 TaxID=2107713 RepID=UPI000E47B2CD|nr:hypothetical protein [Aeromicrobium sp. A1-2]AXT85553.1 hypothetical protein C6I20_10360 [Aeromicrobium sp. A1-2]